MLDQFHLLSFEGPDAYARAGGIASRIVGLSHALAEANYDVHLWFVGDPHLPGEDTVGGVTWHRWCQWISSHHPAGVYDGETGKTHDYGASLPPFIWENWLKPAVRAGLRPVVLAEEWHTVNAVLHLDWLLRREGVRDRVSILWNANNTFGFDTIDWPHLSRAATILTVSRYMKHRMNAFGVDPVVIPNGLGADSFAQPDPEAVRALRQRFEGRVLLSKVARWDPDKRWLLAVDTVAELKRQGSKPLLVARGGLEAHGQEVIQHACGVGLRVTERRATQAGARGLLDVLENTADCDVVVLGSHLDAPSRGALFQASDALLANSSHEPFGLVGLEAMAVGGLACTGASGEDYAVDGVNALVLQRSDPSEFVSLFGRVCQSPNRGRELRQAGRLTAREYAWPSVVERALIPRI